MWTSILKVFLQILYTIKYARAFHVSFKQAYGFVKHDYLIQKELKTKTKTVDEEQSEEKQS